jgi:hypothetical protein
MYVPQLKSWLLHPRTPPVVPNAKDEEWNDHAGMSGLVNGMAAAWTQFGDLWSGTIAQTQTGRSTVIDATSSGPNNGNRPSGYYRTAPTPPYSVTCELAQCSYRVQNELGIGFRQSGTGELWLAALFQGNAVGGGADDFRMVWNYHARHSSEHNALVSNSAGFTHAIRSSVWFRITDTGSNLEYAWSPTGVEDTFETVVSENYATALLTPDQFLFYVNTTSNGNTARGEFGPLRVT